MRAGRDSAGPPPASTVKVARSGALVAGRRAELAERKRRESSRLEAWDVLPCQLGKKSMGRLVGSSSVHARVRVQPRLKLKWQSRNLMPRRGAVRRAVAGANGERYSVAVAVGAALLAA